MPTLNKIFLAFARFVSFAQAGQTPPFNAAPPAAPKLPEQLAMEKWFIGSWICEGTQHASSTDPAVKFTDRFTFNPAE